MYISVQTKYAYKSIIISKNIMFHLKRRKTFLFNIRAFIRKCIEIILLKMVFILDLLTISNIILAHRRKGDYICKTNTVSRIRKNIQEKVDEMCQLQMTCNTLPLVNTISTT